MPALKHDFAITEHHVVFLEGSVTFDPGEHSGIPYGWNDEQPSRIGVMPRGGGGARRIRWFEIGQGYAMHLANAYEDPYGRIVIEGPSVGRDGWQRSWKWWVGAPERGAEPNSGSRGCRWTVDLSDLNADASRLLVLDASDLGAAPVATVHLPRRVPAMIHGSWIPDAAN
ncbi:carotenoid oxygenase family protein [Streptomyces sp. NPDC058611]|uniref:carotenoid oxygenase family protein n=1 Tax=unclassified Streptomyces TaxID=2593676 RepID=UPI003663F774